MLVLVLSYSLIYHRDMDVCVDGDGDIDASADADVDDRSQTSVSHLISLLSCFGVVWFGPDWTGLVRSSLMSFVFL